MVLSVFLIWEYVFGFWVRGRLRCGLFRLEGLVRLAKSKKRPRRSFASGRSRSTASTSRFHHLLPCFGLFWTVNFRCGFCTFASEEKCLAFNLSVTYCLWWLLYTPRSLRHIIRLFCFFVFFFFRIIRISFLNLMNHDNRRKSLLWCPFAQASYLMLIQNWQPLPKRRLLYSIVWGYATKIISVVSGLPLEAWGSTDILVKLKV